jgi:AcrR family transcriptional regulator
MMEVKGTPRDLTFIVNVVYHPTVVGRPKIRTERLNERSIVGAALTVARHRIADLTMRSVADELQVSVGAVYKHIAGRDDLLALVVEEILGQAPPMTPNAGDGWLTLRAQVLGVQALMDDYPGLDQVVIARSPHSPKANELRHEGMAALESEGLTSDEAHRVYRAVTWLWLGSRVALQGRSRTEADIDTFADALDILISGLKQEIGAAQKGDHVADRRS